MLPGRHREADVEEGPVRAVGRADVLDLQGRDLDAGGPVGVDHGGSR